MQIPKALIESHRKKARATWTQDNVIGARKLAYDLRNHSADYVARQHIAQEDAMVAKKERANREALLARADEAYRDATRLQISTGGLAPETGFPPGLKERISYHRRVENGEAKVYKIIERFHNGALVEEQIVPV